MATTIAGPSRHGISKRPFTEPAMAFFRANDDTTISGPDFVPPSVDNFVLNQADYSALLKFLKAGKALPATIDEYRITYPDQGFNRVPNVDPNFHQSVGISLVRINGHCNEFQVVFGVIGEMATHISAFAKVAQRYYGRIQEQLKIMEKIPQTERENSRNFQDAKRNAIQTLEALSLQAERQEQRASGIVDHLRKLHAQTNQEKQTMEDYSSKLTTIITTISQTLTEKEEQESRLHATWNEVEKNRREANRNRNRSLAMGLVVGVFVNPLAGIAVGGSGAARFQNQYEELKTEVRNIQNQICDLKNLRDALLRANTTINNLQATLSEVTDLVDSALDAVKKVENIFANMRHEFSHIINYLSGVGDIVERGAFDWAIEELHHAYTCWDMVARAAYEFSLSDFLAVANA